MTKRRVRRVISLACLVAAMTGLAGLSGAVAQAPVVLTDVVLNAGPITYRLPRIEIRGGALSEAEARSLFDPAAADFAQKLARLSADEIVVPEVTVEQPLGNGRQTTTYRDLVLSGVAAGRVATVAASGGSFSTAGVDKGGRGRFGRVTGTALDLAQSVAIYAEKGTPDATYRQLYAALSLDDLTMEGPDGVGFKVGRLSARDLKARPTAESWSETVRVLGQLAERPDASPADNAKATALTADLVDAFEFGAFEMSNLEIVAPDPQPQARLEHVLFTGAAAGGRAELRLEGFSAKSPEGTFRLDSLSFADFSFAPVIDGLKKLDGNAMPAADPQALRKFIPVIGTTRLSGLSAEFKADPQSARPPQLFGLKALEFVAEKPVNGIPSSLSMKLDGLAFSVPRDSDEDFLRDLAALGYASANLSARIGATWNEASSELALREASLSGAGMGSVNWRLTFGQVGRDLFDPDTAIASVALLGATLKSAELTVENGGLAEKVLARQAAAERRTPEELRREYGTTAAVGIPALLGNSPQAKSLGAAVARFIAKPGRLAIAARARDGVGLGAGDLALIGDPNSLMGKIEVTAKAE